MGQDHATWEEHLQGYRESGLSVRAYARRHGLVYHRLLYRVRREAKVRASSFVSVTVAEGRTGGGLLGIVALPNGVRIEVYDASLLPWLLECVSGQR
jgi:hypothetical protein